MTTTETRTGFRVDILTPAGATPRANIVASRYPAAVIVGFRATHNWPVEELRAARRALKVWRRTDGAGHDVAELELVIRYLNGAADPYVHAEPVERGTGTGPTFGGCYVTGGEYGLGEVLRAIYGDDRRQVGPIPLHDRWES